MKLYRHTDDMPSLQIEEVSFEIVPWCDEHGSPMMGDDGDEYRCCQRAFYRDTTLGSCRLEDPPRHIVLEG